MPSGYGSVSAEQGRGETAMKPEQKFRSGAISATIWQNEADSPNGKVIYKTVSFERSYKDKEGNWQNTNKLRTADIPKAVLVLNKAYEYLSLGEELEA
jgi:hypothetical protein